MKKLKSLIAFQEEIVAEVGKEKMEVKFYELMLNLKQKLKLKLLKQI